MADETVKSVTVAEETSTNEVYSPMVAGKDSAWMVGKLAAATALVPQVIAALTGFGVTLDPNGHAYKALPYIIFVGLHLAHDFASVRSKFKWI